MNTAIIKSESDKDLKLLLKLAKKLNIKGKLLSKEEEEELGLIKAINSGRTNEYLDIESFLNNIA